MLPHWTILEELFEITENSKTGLRWKERKNNSNFNARYANQPAGSISKSGDGIPAWRVSLKLHKNKVAKYYACRIIFSIFHKVSLTRDDTIEHINGNPLVNKISNLRCRTKNKKITFDKANK